MCGRFWRTWLHLQRLLWSFWPWSNLWRLSWLLRFLRRTWMQSVRWQKISHDNFDVLWFQYIFFTFRCRKDQFYCSLSQKCIPLEKVCDEKYDCHFQEDERYCVALTNNDHVVVDINGKPSVSNKGIGLYLTFFFLFEEKKTLLICWIEIIFVRICGH